jgi:hypothetical protein
MTKRYVSFAAALIGFVAGAISAGSLRHAPGDTAPARSSENGATQQTTNEGDALARALGALRAGSDLDALAEFGAVLKDLDSPQIATLLDQLERNEIQRYDDRLGWLFAWWMKRDPKAAEAWIRVRLNRAASDGPIASYSFETTARGRLFHEWMKASPKGALDYALAHPRSNLSIWIAQNLSRKAPFLREAISKTDEEWFALLRGFPENSAQRFALDGFLDGWADRDHSTAVEAAKSLPAGTARDRALATVLGKWSEKDAAAAINEYRRLGITDPACFSSMLVNATKQDREKALTILEELNPADFARQAPSVVYAWAHKDPVAALSWVVDHGLPLTTRSFPISRTSPMGLGQFSNLGSSFGEIDPVGVAFRTNAGATLAWIQSLPEGPNRESLLLMAACQGNLDRPQALALLSELAPENAPQAALYLAYRFKDDPAAGRAWAESLPPGPTRAAAWRNLGMVASVTPDLPPGPDRDAMLYGRRGSNNGMVLNPSTRLDMTLQIGDPVMRRDAFEDALEYYTGPDMSFYYPNEARAWLEKADVPEEWKQRWR